MGNRKLAKLIRSTGSHAPGRKPAKHSIKADGGSPAPKKQRKASEPSRLPQQAQMSQGNILTENHDAEMGLEESLGGAGDAYKALVGMLSAGRGHVSEALRRRRKEAEGQESGSESQESGDGNESGGESESDSEQHAPGTKLARSRQDQAAAAASKTLLRTRWRDSKKAAAEIHEEEQRNGEGQDSGSDDSVGADSATQQEEQPSDARHPGADEQKPQGQSHAVLLPPPPDTWEQHMEFVLTDTQVQELQGQSSRPKYTDVHHPDHQGALPARCHWQAAQREGLPPAPATLDAYSIKDRLQARWREVHGQDSKEHAQAASAAAVAGASGGGGKGAPEDGSAGVGGMVEEGPASGKRPRGKRPKEQQREQQERREEERRIAEGIGEADRGSGGAFVHSCQRSMFAAMHSYADVTMPCRMYPTSMQDPDPTMDAYLLHCLNHVAKTADRIKRNNARLEAAAKQEQANGQAGSARVEDLPRDQGFTRPKVLILLPQRNLAFKLVVRLVALAMKETRADSVQGKERFVEQFTDPEAEEENMDEGTRNRRKAKPADWRALFSGNTDDHFRLGIKITRGAIRLFADLFDSDIIVASPLALATKLAEDKRRAAGKLDRGKYATAAAAKAAKAAGSKGEAGAGSDFLSSIEVLVMDRADVMAMQNWAHVETVVEALNQLARQQHGVDIMRVREWQLSGWAKHYRQNILLSSFLSPEMNALVGGPLCANHAGRLKVRHEDQGVLARVVPQVQQIFERFKAGSPAAMADARFEHFKHAVWPRLKEACGGGGMLLFVPHYFDFVRLRNFLSSDDPDLFETISEYTAPPDVTAARSRFYHRRVKMLIYTERAHFYHRHRIRGIRDIMFYAPPEHAAFYPDLLNLMEDTGRAPPGPTTANGQPQTPDLASLAPHSTVRKAHGVRRKARMQYSVAYLRQRTHSPTAHSPPSTAYNS